MTRMIERWFPCAEVSANSKTGWGSGASERGLFTWFAARPTVQAKAAVLCSLLPWPDDPEEQNRLQDLVRRALQGTDAALLELRQELAVFSSDGPSILDPFSGRGMIPLQGARLGVDAAAVDYSPIAVLASELLATYPLIDWDAEPDLPFTSAVAGLLDDRPRLVRDVDLVLREVGRRLRDNLAAFYPPMADEAIWGYHWAVTLPCAECGRRFPLLASMELKRPSEGRVPSAEISLDLEIDRTAGTFSPRVIDGAPNRSPTLMRTVDERGRQAPGKSAICPFCNHVHPTAQHRTMAAEGLGQDALMAVVLIDRAIREPTAQDCAAIAAAEQALSSEVPFPNALPAVPHEEIAPGNGSVIQPSIYGASTFGDLMGRRQTLAFVRLCRIIGVVHKELRQIVSQQYADALAGYCAAALVRKLRYSTRGAWLRARDRGSLEVAGIFVNESSIAFSYDFFEAACYGGAGSWESMAEGTVASLSKVMPPSDARPVQVLRGSATALPFQPSRFDAVVTDPPYDQMIAYADTSDLFYVWVRRALAGARPEMSISADPHGAQEKAEEIIVKKFRAKREGLTDHRTREFYDDRMRAAFREARRVVKDEGLVTIVFGHGEPEVWQRLLSSIEQAGLVMTGSWPANTETGGQKGAANIETTLTMACRPAPPTRSLGHKGAVEGQIKAAIKERYPEWERWGLAPADMLMAAAGPAMEVVGRYSRVLDSRGEPVDISTFLPLARAAVQEAMAVDIDNRPLETFDARTRFGLWWLRLYGRQPQAKSELRWQVLASSMDLENVRDLVIGDRAVAFITSSKFERRITRDSAVIDVALVLAAASEDGVAAMGEVLAASPFDTDDQFLWGAIKFIADRLPDADPDSVAFHRVLRARAGIGTAAQNVSEGLLAERAARDLEDRQIRLL